MFLIKIILELVVVALIVYGIFYEEELVELEYALKKKIKVRVRQFVNFCIEITGCLIDLFRGNNDETKNI